MYTKMEKLNELMTLIDAAAERIPEGEYLAMCEAIKGVHAAVKTQPTTAELRSTEYYDLEEELYLAVDELEKLHKKRDEIRYKNKMTKAMKQEAIRDFAFTEGLHSLREYTPEALKEAGFNVNIGVIYKDFLEAYNRGIFEEKRIVQMEVEEARERRDRLVVVMADILI